MCRLRQFALALVLGLSVALPAAGHEADQFTLPPDREFADLGEYFNAWIYRAIEGGVEKTNADIQHAIDGKGDEKELAELQSADHIAKAVNSQFPWAMDVIEGLERKLRTPEMQRKYPGRVLCYKQPFKNIHEHQHFILDPRQFFRIWLASDIVVYRVHMGTDKIGHLTDMGMNYFREYRKAMAEGKSEPEAMSQAVYLGTHGLIFSERGMLGDLSAGDYANGDLAANYVGLLFYRNLSEPVMLKGQLHPALLVRDGPYWKLADYVRRDSDFFAAFVSDHLNELLNPGVYQSGMRHAIRQSTRERAEVIFQYYRDAYGNPLPREYYEKKVQELSTYYGADYGHAGSGDELITIANTCFGDGAPPAPSPTPVYLAIAAPAPQVDYVDLRGRTVLHYAAADSNGASLQSLLARGAPVNAADHDGRTPLHQAAAAGQARAIAELVDHGANVNARDCLEITPLHLAAATKDPVGVKELIDGGGAVGATDEFGCTPLHEAARRGSWQVVALLLKAGADVNARDAYGTTPLHLACRGGHAMASRALLDKGADANAVNAVGCTPLHEAALAGDRAQIRLLLAHGARKEVRNTQGHLARDIAQARGFEQCADLLR